MSTVARETQLGLSGYSPRNDGAPRMSWSIRLRATLIFLQIRSITSGIALTYPNFESEQEEGVQHTNVDSSKKRIRLH
jgi:hypothetical protein